MIKISHDLQYHFIAAAYLSQMLMVSSLPILDGCMISLKPLQLTFKAPSDKSFSMIFQEKNAKN
ncbi:MAG: hypothetical protein FWC10_07885 [Lentimicrobiaceae bacterium]|nr:hypothetical protein [Lentimicrobiaceae bacterium]